MAYVSDNLLDEEKEGGQKSATSGEAVTSSGAAATAGGTGVQTTTGKTDQAKGTGFVNLNKYVDANKGQSQKMAGDIVSTNAGLAGDISSKVGKYGDQTGAAISQGAFKSDTSMLNDPRKLDKAQFSDAWNASYAGPKSDAIGSGDDSKAIYKALDQLGQNAANTGSFEGRQQLVRGQYNKDDRYSRGENVLDSFLVNDSADQLKTINNLADTSGSSWESMLSGLRDKAKAAEADTNKSRDAFRDAFSTQFGGLQGKLDQSGKDLVAANKQRDQQFSSIIDQLSQGKAGGLGGLDDATLKLILDQGYDPRNLVARGGALNLADVADKDVVSQYQALQALSDITGQAGKSYQGLTTPSGAGNAYNVMQGQVDSARDYATNYGNLTSMVDRAKAGDVNLLAQALNVRPQDILDAQELGIDLNGLIGKIGIGDFATNDDISALDQLSATLGLTSAPIQDQASAPDLARIIEQMNNPPKLYSDNTPVAGTLMIPSNFEAGLAKPNSNQSKPRVIKSDLSTATPGRLMIGQMFS